MRLGIFTLPLHTNYGGIIQAYALQTSLERLGHEVVVMDRGMTFQRLPWWWWPVAWGKRVAKKLLVDRREVIDKEGVFNRQLPVIRQHTDRFIRQYVHRRLLGMVGDRRAWGDVEGIVVGSDQIWRTIYRGWSRDYADMFLAFAERWPVRRWAYGASFGVDTWDFPMEKTPRYAQLMQLFEGVSVREDSGVALCRDYLHVAAEHVLDPTMLLTADDYRGLIRAWEATLSPQSSFISPQSPQSGGARGGLARADGVLTTYMLDPTAEKEAWVKEVARARGLTPHELNNARQGDEGAPLAARVVPPLEAWLRGFDEAGMVLTDSFHGCVFSIVFRKPFVAIGNKGRGLSRMESLMRMFGLEDHLLASPGEYDAGRSYALPGDIDARMEALRQRSLAFLWGIG